MVNIKNKIEGFIVGFVLLIVMFKIVVQLLPEGQTAGDELQATGAPLGNFFTSDGIVWLLVMVGILLLVLFESGVIKLKGGRRK